MMQYFASDCLVIRNKLLIIQCFLFYTLWLTVHCFSFSDITSTVFADDSSGVTAAFGDFNSDKITDLFRIVDKKRVDVLIGYRTEPLLRKAFSCSVNENEVISSVMPGDFNGDSMMDLLIIVQTRPNVPSDVRILWGSLDKINCSNQTHFKVKIQPLLLDFNGDMIPDLFGEDENGTRTFWIAQNGTFLREEVGNSSVQALLNPHSCSFTDLNFDGVADLFVTGVQNMEYWLNGIETRGFVKNFTFNYPNNTVVRGQSAFIDLNTDGTLEHVMPVCHDLKCMSCSIMVRSLNESKWQVLADKFIYKDQNWCFYITSHISEMPVALRSGDFDMDGHTDFVAVLRNQSESQSGIVLFKNTACSSCPLGRKLVPLWDLVELTDLNSVQLAAFYDIYEDGILDLLVTTQDDSNNFKIHAIQNLHVYNNDAYFIKIIVIGGLCKECPGDHPAYGTNLPGPYIKYVATKLEGSATQMYQSAYFSLQLPYIVFGLGQTPNFVDSLQVTIPGNNQTILRQRTWTQLIPNSQMVVVPYPPDKPEFWLNKLFVTPSDLVLKTLAALIGTCIFIALIIGSLHFKERVEDRREKLLEAHRFHFDAM